MDFLIQKKNIFEFYFEKEYCLEEQFTVHCSLPGYAEETVC